MCRTGVVAAAEIRCSCVELALSTKTDTSIENRRCGSFSTAFPHLWKYCIPNFVALQRRDYMNSWERILQHMERRVNPHSFATWFQPTRQEGADNGKLVVRIPSRHFRKRLTETYGELLNAVLLEVGI